MKPTALKDVEQELRRLDFGEGLTRDDVRRKMPHLPEEIYLELPASKRYRNAADIVHDAVNAPNRAKASRSGRTSTPSTVAAPRTMAARPRGARIRSSARTRSRRRKAPEQAHWHTVCGPPVTSMAGRRRTPSMVHVNIGPRFTKVELPRRPSMLDIAAGAAKLGIASRALASGARFAGAGAKGALKYPGVSTRAISSAVRGTPRWPWESGSSWYLPWRRRRSAAIWRQMRWQGRGGFPRRRGWSWQRGGLAWRRGRAMPWRRPQPPMPWLKRRWALLAGMALGAILMYVFDAEQGNRRRKMAIQRGGKLVRQVARGAGRTSRRIGSELAGKRQALLHGRDHHEALDDATLAHKVETVLFRDPSVPKGDLNVNAEHGVVVIRGEVHDPAQMARIEQMVRRIQGVHEVHSLLHTADRPAPNKRAL